jgi:HEAT repeat protein
LGAPAIKLLTPIMQDADFEVARSARRAVWKIVRHAGRPGAAKEARAVSAELVALLPGTPSDTRRELLWMLSEIGTDETIPAMAALLSDADVRIDAQCAIMRLPGRQATAALKSAFARAPEDFKYALADALRKRGESVKGFPSQKRVPSRPTAVTQPRPA